MVPNGSYGPNYPLFGNYYSREGELIFSGKFEVKKGGVGFPMVKYPKYYRFNEKDRPEIEYLQKKDLLSVFNNNKFIQFIQFAICTIKTYSFCTLCQRSIFYLFFCIIMQQNTRLVFTKTFCEKPTKKVLYFRCLYDSFLSAELVFPAFDCGGCFLYNR